MIYDFMTCTVNNWWHLINKCDLFLLTTISFTASN